MLKDKARKRLKFALKRGIIRTAYNEGKVMPREKITVRQKDISRLLREKRQIYREKLKVFKKKK